MSLSHWSLSLHFHRVANLPPFHPPPPRIMKNSGGQDSTIKLFDALSGETLHVLPGLESGTGSLAFSPFSFGSLIDSLHPIPTEATNNPSEATNDPSDPAATENGTLATTRTRRLGVGKYGLLAGGGWDGVLRIWDVESGKVLWGMEVEEEEGKRMVRERPMMVCNDSYRKETKEMKIDEFTFLIAFNGLARRWQTPRMRTVQQDIDGSEYHQGFGSGTGREEKVKKEF